MPEVRPLPTPLPSGVRPIFCCPTKEDAPDDVVILTTMRRLTRVATIAADVGARFARTGVQHDPVAWMLAPRRAFNEACALEACQQLRHFERAVALNARGELDAEPDDLDDPTEAVEDAPGDGPALSRDTTDARSLCATTVAETTGSAARPAFHAGRAASPE